VRALSGFALSPIAQQNPEASPRSHLLYEGQATGTTLPGAVLEGQFEVGDRYLLLVTDDVPYEEILRFYLLDRSFALLDELELGEPYAPGIVKNLEIEGERELGLSFQGESRWNLRVAPHPVRGLIRKRYLELSRRQSDRL
jgi:hypothetical protein